MLRTTVLKLLLIYLMLAQSGCIGGMIMLSGKDLDFDNDMKRSDFRSEFGPPRVTQQLMPPVPYWELQAFEGSEPAETSSGDLGKAQYLATFYEQYRYQGRVSGWHDSMATMVMGIEGTWTLLTLGLAQIYYIPLGVSIARDRSYEIRDIHVAFDQQGQVIRSRVVRFTETD